MKTSPRRTVAWVLGALAMMYAETAHAQFTGDYQTNIVSGTTVDWTGTYAVGSNTAYDFLGIDSGGVLVSDAGGIGVDGTNAGNDAVSVSGTGSVWSNSSDLTIGYSSTSGNNSLMITDGGVVYDGNCIVQAANNAILVSGNGSTWNNSGFLALGGGSGVGHHSLTVADGGMVSDDTFSTGGNAGGMTILVMGPGSVWSNSNDLSFGDEGGDSLVVSNGGAVYDRNGSIGQSSSVLITGTGSVWSNSNSLSVGGQHTSVIISNGGAVYCASSDLSSGPGSTLAVTGAGSVFHIDGNLFVGDDQSLFIADGGVICAASMVDGAFITVSGGGLHVTNGLGTGMLTVQSGDHFILNSGTVTADNLLDGGNLTFNGGVLNIKATTVNNGSVFTVGDGADVATFKLDSGGSGFHSFANGLIISSNAVLKGNGTIVGNTVVNGGGMLAPGGSPGSITFSNNLTLAQNSTFAVELDDPSPGQYDQIVSLGTVSISNSVLSLTLGYTPSIGDSFTIISNLGSSAVFGQFVDLQGDVLTNNATFAADSATFEISYSGNADGQDVVLTATVPEPSSLVMTGLGVVAMFGGWRLRKRPLG